MLEPQNRDEYDEMMLACIRDGTTAQASSTLSVEERGRYICEELHNELMFPLHRMGQRPRIKQWKRICSRGYCSRRLPIFIIFILEKMATS